MTLQETAERYYFDENYNCAEAIIHACNDVYDLQITPEDMIMMAGFGSGMYAGLTCGALSACIAVLSKMLVKTKAHEQVDLIRPAANRMARNFKEALGDTSCAVVRAHHFDPEVRCHNTVQAAVQALEKTLSELEPSQS